VGEVKQADVYGSCFASGSGELTGGSGFHGGVFGFDLEASAATLTYSGPIASGVLSAAVVDDARCTIGPVGDTVEIVGTGSWSGTPGHRFVFHVVHPTSSTPPPGLSLDSVSMVVVAPSGEVAHTETGFLWSGVVTTEATRPFPSTAPCSASVPDLAIDSHQRVTLSASDDPFVSGTVTYRRTGGGPPFVFEGQAFEMECFHGGGEIAYVRGFGTVNGIGGYRWAANLRDNPGFPNVFDLRLYDAEGTQIWRWDELVADDVVTVVYPDL
jgi:hypothetical protein